MIKMSACGHAMLLHRLKQRGLGLGRGAVDFIRQDDIGKNGSLDVLEAGDVLAGRYPGGFPCR